MSLVNSNTMALPNQHILVSPGLSASNKRKVQEMVAILEDSSFWHSLAQCKIYLTQTAPSNIFQYSLKTHLKPLARAANVAQVVFCRLDQILLTFRSLSIYYEDNKAQDPANVPGCTAILDSIKKRWAKADQDVFVATILLNLFIKTSMLDPTLPFLTHAGVYALMKCLYQHFFSVTETTAVLEQDLWGLLLNIEEYFMSSGSFSHMEHLVFTIEEELQIGSMSPDPNRVRKGMSPIAMTGVQVQISPLLFIKLTQHLLSICPNSASCERLFSMFGNTLTKLRNHLGIQMLTSLAELKMHIQDEHLRNKDTKEHMKCFFGKSSAPSETTTPPPPTLPPTEEMEIDNMNIDPELEALSASGVGNTFNAMTDSFGRQAC
ncbi:hypothetical protein EDB92DRAFT_1952750 [Lactarius akahatsu]|uniref:HAT C-terminal dimerisation domain-containing protein n=1 Tax=Lactarius akahatsu TaxID=416441 RepID=A0AAD4L8W4_9AGAM|nr:hypothetical protein EDB92DRAFT_1952750 [Lactarius akahatsu]